MRRILLLGARGQLGRELARTLAPLGRLEAVTRNGPDGIDLARPEDLPGRLARSAPDWIVNAAAYTAVDRAESEEALAVRINGEAVGVLGAYAAEHDAALVHFSTDYVFDGQGSRPYRESDPLDPVNAYGRSKLAGEAALEASGCRHLLLRTAWVYGQHGHNFLRSILRHARQREELAIVDDQRGAPAWSRMLAQLTALALCRLEPRGWESLGGCYHLSATGETSWYGFARRFLERAAEHGLLERLPRLRPIRSADYPTAARRPAYSVLDNTRFQERFGLRVPAWEQQIDWCMEDFSAPAD